MQRSELISKVKNVQIKARYLVSDVLAGEYKSAFRGQGIEFSEVREYIPGDDIRSIDWNVTARMDIPFIKEFNEERELTMMIVLDLSSSQKFGSNKSLKIDLATELSAVLSYLALNNNDKVGLIAFTDKVEKYIPPKKGKTNIWEIIREILTFVPENKHTDISNALDFLMNVTKRKSIIFLISDFIDSGYEKQMRMVSKKHDLIAVKITDPRENKIPEAGFVHLEDSETGELILIDTFDRKFVERYHKAIEEQHNYFMKFLKTSRIDYLEIDTVKPYIKDLMRFFRIREKRFN